MFFVSATCLLVFLASVDAGRTAKVSDGGQAEAAATSTFGQEDCNLDGRCVGIFLHEENRPTMNDCIMFGRDQNSASWVSWSPLTTACYAFGSCTDLVDDDEAKSTSSSLQCPVCSINGNCHGDFIDSDVVESEADCLAMCMATQDCQWYTFYVDDLLCIMLHDCSLRHECSNCQSGERACGSNQPTTEVPTTTTTQNPATTSTIPVSTTTATTTHVTTTTTTAAPSGYVLLVGGRYDSMETWADSDDNHPQYNSIPRADLYGSRAAALDSGELFSCGGRGAWRDCFTTTEGQPDWKPAPSLNVGRYRYSLTQVDGRLVAAGGRDDGSNRLSSVEMFTAENGGWSTASWSLKTPVDWHCGLASSDNKHIVILGGYTDSGYSDDVDQYNIETGQRTSLPNLPQPVGYAACTIFNNKIVISGGDTGSDRLDEVWQLEGDEWVALPSLQQARNSHAMGVLGGQLYVFGGYPAYRSVERFNGDKWEEVVEGLEGNFENGGAIFIE